MAIMGPTDLGGSVTRLGRKVNDSMKHYLLAKMGHPVVHVEITESQIEAAISVAGDFIATYFPLEERYAYFYTQPLEPEYSIPTDAYFVREVNWDPNNASISDIFSIDYITFNAANIVGYNSLLSDYHLIRDYQKFASRVLGIEGKWEYHASTDTIRLYPVPKGTFPVVVRYCPIVTAFEMPWAKELFSRMMLAEVKIMVGMARRKMNSVPSPDGGTLSLDGDQLVAEGKEERKEAEEAAKEHAEPLRPYFG